MNTENPIKPIDLAGIYTPGLRVQITQEDIDVAIPKNSGHCMIADAAKRCFFERFKRKATAVSVDLQTIRLTDREKKVRYVYAGTGVAPTSNGQA